MTHEPVEEQPGDTRIAEFRDDENGLLEDKTLRLKGLMTIKIEFSNNVPYYYLHIIRSNDLYGKLAHDDVFRNTCDARFNCFDIDRTLYQRFIYARLQQVCSQN